MGRRILIEEHNPGDWLAQVEVPAALGASSSEFRGSSLRDVFTQLMDAHGESLVPPEPAQAEDADFEEVDETKLIGSRHDVDGDGHALDPEAKPEPELEPEPIAETGDGPFPASEGGAPQPAEPSGAPVDAPGADGDGLPAPEKEPEALITTQQVAEAPAGSFSGGGVADDAPPAPDSTEAKPAQAEGPVTTAANTPTDADASEEQG